jgi:hypothetical protein
MLKVKRALGSPNDTYTEIELDVAAPKDVKEKINLEVAQYLHEQTLLSMSRAESPVEGESWPALSKKSDYIKKKIADGGTDEADMELTGAMKDAFDYEADSKKIRLGFFGTDEAWKADGHLKFSGKTGTAPRHRFLPGVGQEFDQSIQDGVEQIVADNLVEAAGVQKEMFDGIDSKSALYGVLETIFEDMTRAEIREAITRSVELTEMLDELGLLEML